MFVGWLYMEVSQNGGPKSFIFVGFSITSNPFTPKPSILVGLSIINHPLLGTFILGNLIYIYIVYIMGKLVEKLQDLHPFSALTT